MDLKNHCDKVKNKETGVRGIVVAEPINLVELSVACGNNTTYGE